MSYALQGVLLMVPALGFASLALDIGYLRCVGREVQTAADAGALAAAAYVSDEVAADAVAANFVAMHSAGAGSLTVAPGDVQIGTWDGTSFQQTPTGKYVRVTVSAAPPSIVAQVFGVSSLSSQRTAIATKRSSTLCGLIALSKYELNGKATVDAYDSTTSVLASPTFDDVAGVCTNATSVKLEDNMTVYGDVLAGPGGTVTTTASSKVTGTKGALPTPLVAPAVTKPSSTKALPASITTPTTLTPGVYYRSGSFSITGAGSLTVTGETELYIAGDVTLNTAGGVVNTTLDPSQLTIYVMGKVSGHIVGSTKFYGAFVAPQSEVELNGNAVVHGTVTGGYVHLNGNFKMHQDNGILTGDAGGTSAALVY